MRPQLCLICAVLIASNAAWAEESVRPSIGTHQQPDFFFFETTHSTQSPKVGPPQGRFGVLRYCDGAYRSDSVDRMLSSFEPGVPVCILVHGSFVARQWALNASPMHYSRLLASGGNRPLHLIAFHWPSDVCSMPGGFAELCDLGRKADYNGLYLAQLINMIPPENPVCLLGHSHGARISGAALHTLAGGSVSGYTVPMRHDERRLRAVFTAGSIDQHWLCPGERFGRALNPLECVLNFQNRLDAVLCMYPLRDPLWHHPVGKSGFSTKHLRDMGWQAAKVAQVNATSMVGCGHVIARYYQSPQLRAHVVPYLYFD